MPRRHPFWKAAAAHAAVSLSGYASGGDGRAEPEGNVEGVLNADERVDLDTMLAAYTINGAHIMHHDAFTGSIEVGKAADLVVLDRNLFELPPDEIGGVTVLRTLIDGETVYRSAASL